MGNSCSQRWLTRSSPGYSYQFRQKGPARGGVIQSDRISIDVSLAGTTQDLSLTFGYNPAGQITSRTSSNDAYAFTQSYNVDRSYTTNGLNQYTQTGSIAPTYDARGNLTQAGGQTYQYNTRNQLFQTGTSGQLFYRNPAGTLSQILSGGSATALEYVGSLLATEYSGSGTTRYVYGPGSDEPLVWYNGSGTSDRRYLHADERGSVIAVTNDAGTAIAINAYDEYGIPGSGNIGRFQYTGQKWIPELGMYDYKARMYSPTLGRFLQTDPIGYGDGLNWYNYVGGDPVNFSDPSGLNACADLSKFTKVPGFEYTDANGATVIVAPICGGSIIQYDPPGSNPSSNQPPPHPPGATPNGGIAPPQSHRYTTSRRLTRVRTH